MASKLEVEEHGNELTITKRWFGYGVLFLIMFAIIWDGFLIVWYGMAFAGGAPTIAILFPLLHVAAGIGITYTAITGLVNSTVLKINDNALTIKHGPLPWPGNKTVDVTDIEQFYVKQSAHTKDGNTTYSYMVRAKSSTGKDIKILKIPNWKDADEALKIERLIENHLGIKDVRLPEEYQGYKPKQVDDLVEQRRKTSVDSPTTDVAFHNLKKGDFVDYDRKKYEVSYSAQFDWKDGDTDREFQLLEIDNSEVLVFLQQNRGIWNAFIHTKLDAFEANSIFFSANNPPNEIQYKGSTFKQSVSHSGNMFVPGSRESVEVDMWEFTSDESQLIRIFNYSGMLKMYEAKQEILASFTNMLTA